MMNRPASINRGFVISAIVMKILIGILLLFMNRELERQGIHLFSLSALTSPGLIYIRGVAIAVSLGAAYLFVLVVREISRPIPETR